MEIGATTIRPVSLFYSYSHRDEEFRRALETHLSVLRRSRLIAEWHDRMIGAGGDWKGEIDRNLATADIVLLLVSADFIASDYCWSEEMTRALQRHERGEARVIPVILRPCRWLSTPLARLQTVPKDGRAVTDWVNRDAAFDDVAAAIERVIEDFHLERLRAAEEARRQAEEEERERQWRAQRSEEVKREIAEKEAQRKAAEAKAGENDRGTTKSSLRGWLIARAFVALVAGGVGAVFVGRESPETVAIKSPTPVPAPAPKPGDTFVDCEKCPEMVVIDGGVFKMGSPANEEGRDNDEGPQRQVTIAPLAIGRTEVTFDQWDACVTAAGCNGYRPSDKNWGRGSQPVINVSWDDAQAYAGWLSKQTGKPYRLPTEAEWEYAARAGTTTPFSFGATITTQQANYDGNSSGSKGEYRQRTVAAGSLPPNPWGLYEVHGNVWEWVEDCWHDSYQGAPQDGSAWTSGA